MRRSGPVYGVSGELFNGARAERLAGTWNDLVTRDRGKTVGACQGTKKTIEG